VEAQADRAPDAIAVSAGGQCLSYRALDERANQLAHRLQELGVGPDSPVAICMDRSPDLIVGLLGILKAGGAYVPLDPSLPAGRLTFLVEDAGSRALVTERRFLSSFSASTVPLVALDGPDAPMGRESVGRVPIARGQSPRDRAYIVYTSGSTGAPKGVEVEQRGAVNAIRDVIDRLRLGPAHVWTAITTVAFDVASLEIWAALAAGARLEVVPSPVVADGERLAALVKTAGTTVLLGTPSLWQMLLDSGWSGQPGLKMICGGEPLTRDLADALLERGAELWNQYGPTEATMYVTTERVMRGEEVPPTLGRPIANVRAYVLDAQGEPAPIGVPGELWIAGRQVARGYLNRPEETGRSFDDDPWFPGCRRYRTGDLARYRDDGNLEYLGRLDAQVKIRGHRVELGEIEAAIASHPAVRSAVVPAPVSGGGGLVAYCLLGNDRARPTAEELRSFLRASLPSHMVPTDFALLDRLPLTPRGKVDRRAVVRVASQWLERAGAEAQPTTGVEETVAGIWAHVLKLEQVGIHDNFFDLGGHSLLATQVASRIRETLQVDLPLRDLFEAPTVADLSQRIAERLLSGDGALYPAIRPRVDVGPAVLSFSQERMWFLHQLAPESAAYNVPMAIRVSGPVDVDALMASLRDIVRRHEILRTVFPVVDGTPMQVVTDASPEITIEDLEPMAAHTRQARARAICRTESRRPFDLARGPLLRVLMLRLGEGDHIVLLNMHHIVCDQWSFGVLGRELIALYEAHCAGRPSPLEPLGLQFGDFAAWQREWLSGGVLQAHLAFWRRHLGGHLPVLALPSDRTRPAIPSHEGGCETRRVAPALRSAVEAFSRREQTSVFMTLMAAFTALLARYSGGDDILVGIPIANRNYLASENLIGDFVNTLPIRTTLADDPTFHELVRRVKGTLLDAYAHQDAPFDKLVQELQPARYASHAPMVQVLMNLLNAPMPPEQWADLRWQPFLFDRGAAQFDLTLTVEWEREGWIILEYSSDLFERATAGRIVEQFEMLLRAAVANPDGRLSQLPLLGSRDAENLLVACNRTAIAGAIEGSIHQLFERQADRTPDAVAVVDPRGSLTYRELDSRANRIARHLRTLGVGRETRVGVCLGRSRMTFAALLGVLKAGGAFVPLDPSYPAERLGFMMADSGAPALVTMEGQPRDWVPEGVQVVLLDTDQAVIARQSTERLALTGDPEGLAYVIYTSGSTGTPKGVLGLHRGAINRFQWMWRTYPFRRDEMCCQKTSTSFVDSIWEMFGPLLRGVPIAVIPDEVVRDPRELIRMLAERRVTRLVLVPSLLRAMLDAEPELGARLPALHLWVSSGEALTGDLARRFRMAVPRALLLNLYGSSEASGDSTFHEVKDADGWAAVPIGRPIDNTEIYILDRNGQLVPVGVPGELYIGGAGLARGYLDRPDLTAEKFVSNPFGGKPSDRMYRTGDRARYRGDGAIEYLGRLDSQVKIRGFRIDLGEVECALAAHPDVAKAIAVTREDDTGDCRLVGYVVANAGTRATDILEFVRRRLAGYMVPSALVLLDALPLTPNGKVDRQALPAPDAIRREVAEPPRTSTEAVLSAIWADILGMSEVGVHDNFFELGGHSLLAVQLVARIEQVFLTKLPLRSLFEAPTVAGLASLIVTPTWEQAVESGALESDRVEIEL
jgi:amino acid adenylation domain-containing protein